MKNKMTYLWFSFKRHLGIQWYFVNYNLDPKMKPISVYEGTCFTKACLAFEQTLKLNEGAEYKFEPLIDSKIKQAYVWWKDRKSCESGDC